MDQVLIYVGAGLAVGLAGFGVALGQAMIAKESIEILGKNPKLVATLQTYTVLGIALTETAAIYGLVIAFNIVWSDVVTGAQAIGAGLSIGLTGMGVGLAQGKFAAGVLDAINRNPENKKTVMQFMFLFIALLESVAIYGLVLALNILG